MDTKLTKQDLTDLIDAVEEWERSIEKNGALGDMLGMMLSPAGPDMLENAKREMRQRQAEEEPKKRLRKEKSIMLRAKLLMLRDGVEAEELASPGAPGRRD